MWLCGCVGGGLRCGSGEGLVEDVRDVRGGGEVMGCRWWTGVGERWLKYGGGGW